MKRITGECPLGAKCEDVKVINGEQVIITCPLFIKLQGKDKQGNDHDEWNCSFAWMPILQIEVAGTNRGQTQAIESLRNETVIRQDKFNKLAEKAIHRKSLEVD